MNVFLEIKVYTHTHTQDYTQKMVGTGRKEIGIVQNMK